MDTLFEPTAEHTTNATDRAVNLSMQRREQRQAAMLGGWLGLASTAALFTVIFAGAGAAVSLLFGMLIALGLWLLVEYPSAYADTAVDDQRFHEQAALVSPHSTFAQDEMMRPFEQDSSDQVMQHFTQNTAIDQARRVQSLTPAILQLEHATLARWSAMMWEQAIGAGPEEQRGLFLQVANRLGEFDPPLPQYVVGQEVIRASRYLPQSLADHINYHIATYNEAQTALLVSIIPGYDRSQTIVVISVYDLGQLEDHTLILIMPRRRFVLSLS